MLDIEGKEPIHYPARSTVFEFDEEVAFIFDNMAVRSIPMYEEARRITAELSARLIRSKWSGKDDVCVLDVGSSTGAFYKSLWKALGYDVSESIPGLDAVAIDKSPPMVQRTVEDLGAVRSINADILDLAGSVPCQYDIINLAYLIQFIPSGKRGILWSTISRLLRPGGLVIVSSKEAIIDDSYEFFNSQYIQFREENGYTKEEIEAKTKALRGSMEVESAAKTIAYMQREDFTGYREICRWLQFSTMIAYKRG